LPAEDIAKRIAAVHHSVEADMLASLRREAAATMAVAAAITAGTAAALGTLVGVGAALRWLGLTAAGLVLVAGLLLRFLREHRLVAEGPLLPHLGTGIVATLGRGILTAFLLGFLGLDPAEERLVWAPAILYTAVALLDHGDGRLARRGGTATRLGEHLDVEYDAFGNLTAYAVAVHAGRLPIAFVAVGALRYIYATGLWLWARGGRKLVGLPPSTARRVVASLQSGFLCGALSPIVDASALTVAGAVLATALLASFARDGLAAVGVLESQSAAARVAEKRFRDVAFGFLPIPLRFGVAALAVSRAIEGPDSGFGDAAWLRIVLILLAVMIALGVAARSAALVLLLGIAALPASGGDPTPLWMVAGAALVVLLGSGGGSIWEPEPRLFRI
jgi:CDP-diacylglycerol--glycerol-3-phosphate 3-phosphatidyltransferase